MATARGGLGTADLATGATLEADDMDAALESAWEQRVDEFAELLKDEVRKAEVIPVLELVQHAVETQDVSPSLIREALTRLLYVGGVRITEDRQLRLNLSEA